MKTEKSANLCPKCQASLPANAPQGLCPKCLLAAGATPTEAGQVRHHLLHGGPQVAEPARIFWLQSESDRCNISRTRDNHKSLTPNL
jgi:predicted amidophosphoribosyltransferase